MDARTSNRSAQWFFPLIVAFVFVGATAPPPKTPPILIIPPTPVLEKGTVVASLKDFTKEEVRGIGITLTKDVTVHISAVGGGDRSFFGNTFGEDESEQMFAAGWIINAEDRKPVWNMTMDNTSGRANRRTCEEDVTLKKGSYEVYFMAYGYSAGRTFSHWPMNIDRRQKHRSSDRMFGGLLNLFRGDDKELYDEFMEYARDTWGITLTVPDGDASSVTTFGAPKTDSRSLVSEIRVGDNVVYRKDLVVGRDVTMHVYAVGEGRKNDELFDYGWLVNADTRVRVWEMNRHNVVYAGGSSKNIKYEGDVSLTKGTYELCFVTDGSHSSDDWNARPPYDPFNYGITVSLVDAGDAGSVKVVDPPREEKNVLVSLVRMRDNDYKSAGFSLKKDGTIRIYALGESVDDNREMVDYAWVVNARSRERVWTMDARRTFHAGGASKNRFVDEIVELPKGDYVAYYQTDGSHSYDEWNADPPFDPEHWGLTIMGAGKDFDPSSVSSFNEDNEAGVIAQLIRVSDDKHVHQRFTLSSKTKVRVYALGEADGDELADYGWIKNTETGETIWRMEIDETSWAGGAKKNRVADKTITLDKGEYEINYRTDGSHAFNDWNDDPPDDRAHWGITVYAIR